MKEKKSFSPVQCNRSWFQADQGDGRRENLDRMVIWAANSSLQQLRVADNDQLGLSTTILSKFSEKLLRMQEAVDEVLGVKGSGRERKRKKGRVGRRKNWEKET